VGAAAAALWAIVELFLSVATLGNIVQYLDTDMPLSSSSSSSSSSEDSSVSSDDEVVKRTTAEPRPSPEIWGTVPQSSRA
jgi:hypothetical protein